MANIKRNKTVCPKCGKVYSEPPALSRTDNKTLICPDCGLREAFASVGATEEEQERAVKVIHEARKEQIKNA